MMAAIRAARSGSSSDGCAPPDAGTSAPIDAELRRCRSGAMDPCRGGRPCRLRPGFPQKPNAYDGLNRASIIVVSKGVATTMEPSEASVGGSPVPASLCLGSPAIGDRIAPSPSARVIVAQRKEADFDAFEDRRDAATQQPETRGSTDSCPRFVHRKSAAQWRFACVCTCSLQSYAQNSCKRMQRRYHAARFDRRPRKAGPRASPRKAGPGDAEGSTGLPLTLRKPGRAPREGMMETHSVRSNFGCLRLQTVAPSGAPRR